MSDRPFLNTQPPMLTRLPALMVLSLAAGTAVSAQGRAQRVAPLTAIVTDSKGVATEVSGLKVRYWDQRQGDNRLDPVELPALVFQIETQEGRVTATDEITVPLRDIRKLSLPGNYRIEIERRNGSTVVFDQIRAPDWTPDRQRSLLERDSQGAVVKDLKFHGYEVATLRQDGAILDTKVMRPMVFGGFVGRAKMSSGREGDFFIRATEVKTIEVK